MTVAPADRAADARLAILVLAAEEMYDAQGPAAIEPVLDPRITANWVLRGYITGQDGIFRILGKLALGEQRVFYGLVLESKASPGKFATVIRGTAGAVEWWEDCEGIPTGIVGLPGLVEAGFVGIRNTFFFRPPGGRDAPLVPALKALTTGAPLAVTGHSLGSALATYVAYDAALAAPGRISLRVFASPHPGNSTFTEAVAAVIPDHAHYRQVNDKVPEVPIALGYAQLPNTIVLQPVTDALEIQNTWSCSHHLLSYIALTAPEVLPEAYSSQNQPYLSCIVSRAAGPA